MKIKIEAVDIGLMLVFMLLTYQVYHLFIESYVQSILCWFFIAAYLSIFLVVVGVDHGKVQQTQA